MKKRRFKKLKMKLSEQLEEAYQKYLQETQAGKKNSVKTVDRMEVRRNEK